MTRFIKRGGKVWIKVFPDKPVTKKPARVGFRFDEDTNAKVRISRPGGKDI